ncbi:hypothetical protein JRO89_XS03G0069200 [Xanthoceras sorbifolium]|uniref:GATA-type domain-containing protein n=1 Tax=Xanthoceras sorbifolium TaxID=99658 RepID=A0ABQ8I9Y1_9ROSI|nr:hypothetical protein JRO89_XS03G0069200 [Xanthoceras sorbifolium]
MESLDTAAGFMDDLLDFSSDIGEEDDDGLNNKRARTALPSLTRNGPDSASLNILNPLDPSPPFPVSFDNRFFVLCCFPVSGQAEFRAHSALSFGICFRCRLGRDSVRVSVGSHIVFFTKQDFAEEELEWLSNKDAFPGVDTFVDVLCNPIPKHHSPVSVLENSNNSSSSTTSTNSSSSTTSNNGNTIMNCCGNLSVPVRARSKCRRTPRRDFQSQNYWWSCGMGMEEKAKSVKLVGKVSIGRKCQHCGAEKTPQWRAGPLGPKTLCNACGVRYKSGRLVPEYRPASSPTFSTELHSNSHRKVLEMRRQKQMTGMGIILGLG